MRTPTDFLEKLVSFDTTTAKSNMELIDFVADHLRGHGIESTLVRSPEGDKANLWATIGPKKEGGVCLSGHTDVVPVTGQPWDTDPFTMTRKGSRLYGRGTCDMKAFPATALALLPEMLAQPLARPIHFAFSYDEEIGCKGAPSMIAEIGRSLPKPSVVIVGEPTDMKVVSAHKGMWFFSVVVTGKEAHSSQTHRGVSAVMTGARLIAKLDEMAKARAAAADPACKFVPPYTTIHVGTVQGGTASNIISRHCEFVCDIRNLPDDFPEEIQEEFEAWIAQEILPEMHAIDPSTSIKVTTENVVAGLREDRDSEAEQLVRQLTGDNDMNYVPYGTEAGQFQRAGMAVVVCGPGSIDQAHQPNEFIESDQIDQCEAMLRKLILRCRK
ncbi:acetylornithine deacetylase [Rhodospirillaceae bacterium KN72]|uniref:Acetylornithine deacetylase n=1 Tax=Pacificispira spongiicola TaxID=2729598 RepID=A0A7Y0DX20_9PROT|nr:acetylornithine deacetylase [Pacificispira spongiicola]NMM43180.1 acetylornithine deacetylase [Pacificispira spongiicola]